MSTMIFHRYNKFMGQTVLCGFGCGWGRTGEGGAGDERMMRFSGPVSTDRMSRADKGSSATGTARIV